MSAILIFIAKAVFILAIYGFLYQLVRTAQSDLMQGMTVAAQKKQQEPVDNTQEFEIRPDLVVEKSGQLPVGKRYHLVGGLTIGRSKNSDIVLSDAYVSSAHARIYRVATDFFIEDMGSTNGTYLNDVRIDQPMALKDGYELIIGDNIFRFEE